MSLTVHSWRPKFRQDRAQDISEDCQSSIESLLPTERSKVFRNLSQSTTEFQNFRESSVDSLKITEDRSSDNRVHALDARLIKATRAEPRCRARSPCLNTTTMPRRRNQSPRLSTTSIPKHRGWSLRLTRKAQHRVWSSHFNTTMVPKREAQDPRLKREAR